MVDINDNQEETSLENTENNEENLTNTGIS